MSTHGEPVAVRFRDIRHVVRPGKRGKKPVDDGEDEPEFAVRAANGSAHDHEKRERVILSRVSGYAMPGQVLGVFGPSGAGKTMLMDILAGRVRSMQRTAHLRGSSWRRTSGAVEITKVADDIDATNDANWTRVNSLMDEQLATFVEQDSIGPIAKTFTVRELFTFTANMFKGGLGDSPVEDIVNETIELLGLSQVSDSLVPSLSGGERRRVAIGMDGLLVPARVLFLDEPTSGLSSTDALNLMTVIKDIAVRRNMTVIATMHQPSVALFRTCIDRVLLLSGQNGELAFSGTREGCEAFLKRIGMSSPHDNPADVMIDVVSDDTLSIKCVSKYRTYSRRHPDDPFEARGKKKHGTLRGDEIKHASAGLYDSEPLFKAAAARRSWLCSSWSKLRTLLAFYTRQVPRRPDAYKSPIIMSSLVGLFMVGMFFQLDEDEVFSRVNASLLVPFLFDSLMVTMMNTYIVERQRINKELDLGYYGDGVHTLAWTYLSVVRTLLAMSTALIPYFGIGFKADLHSLSVAAVAIVTRSVIVQLTAVLFTLCIPHYDISVAGLVNTIYFIVEYAGSGMYLSKRHMPAWLSALTPYNTVTRAAHMVLVSEFEGTVVSCDPPGSGSRPDNLRCPATGHQILVSIGFDSTDTVWDDAVFLCKYIGCLIAAVYVVQSLLTWRRRSVYVMNGNAVKKHRRQRSTSFSAASNQQQSISIQMGQLHVIQQKRTAARQARMEHLKSGLLLQTTMPSSPPPAASSDMSPVPESGSSAGSIDDLSPARRRSSVGIESRPVHAEERKDDDNDDFDDDIEEVVLDNDDDNDQHNAAVVPTPLAAARALPTRPALTLEVRNMTVDVSAAGSSTLVNVSDRNVGDDGSGDDNANVRDDQCSAGEFDSDMDDDDDANAQNAQSSSPRLSPRMVMRKWRETRRNSRLGRIRRVLLHKVGFTCRPGEVTAIMGPSGAGKTTLLSAVLGKLPQSVNKQSGRVFINGKRVRNLAGSGLVAYVMQDELLPDMLTIKQALKVSAALNHADKTAEQRTQFVRSTLKLLNLHEARHTMLRACSGGQRKRASIGVSALLTDASVIVLDEPTTGLSAHDAQEVMDVVHTLASARNLTVLCTLHQPRKQIFTECIDNVLLLAPVSTSTRAARIWRNNHRSSLSVLVESPRGALASLRQFTMEGDPEVVSGRIETMTGSDWPARLNMADSVLDVVSRAKLLAKLPVNEVPVDQSPRSPPVALPGAPADGSSDEHKLQGHSTGSLRITLDGQPHVSTRTRSSSSAASLPAGAQSPPRGWVSQSSSVGMGLSSLASVKLAEATPIPQQHQRKLVPWYTELRVLLWRQWAMAITDYRPTMWMWVIVTCCAGIVAVMYNKVELQEYRDTYATTHNVFGGFAILVLPQMGWYLPFIPVVDADVKLHRHRLWTAAVSEMVVQFSRLSVGVLLYTMVVFFSLNMGDDFVLVFTVLLTTVLIMDSLAVLAICMLSDPQAAASAIVPPLTFVLLQLDGFWQPMSATPVVLRWLAHINPLRLLLSSLMSGIYGDLGLVQCNQADSFFECPFDARAMLRSQDIEPDDKWRNVATVVLAALALRALAVWNRYRKFNK